MQNLARWKAVSVWLVFAASLLLLLPSLLPASSLPAWIAAHRLMPGLDLTGGSRLTLDVSRGEIEAEKLRDAVEATGAALRAARIPYADLSGAESTVELTVTAADRVSAAREALSATGLGTVSEAEGGQLRIALPASAVDAAMADASERAVEAVSRRLASLDVPALRVERDDSGRISVSMPGLSDPQRAKDLLDQAGQLSARLVDVSMPVNAAIENGAPEGTDVLYTTGEPPVGYLVRREALFTVADVASAEAAADGEPRVDFRLTPEATARLAAFTRQNTGRALALVLDDQIISITDIQRVVSDGTGSLTGDFDAEGAANLARVVASGPLPASLTIIEERSIEPVLGTASTGSVVLAVVAAVVAVVAFMTLFYGLLGVIAALSLLFNLLLTFALIALVGLPISLSMIAGVVLTVGVAVDAAVLVFERIREEVKDGRTLGVAVDIGFARARATVLDAIATMLIAVAVLFLLSAAPVRAFALAVGIGLVATIFTTFGSTEAMVRRWLGGSTARQMPKGVRTALFDRLNLRFMAARNVVFLLTAVFSLAIAGLLVSGKLRLGIDFTGGAALEVQAKTGKADLEGIAATLEDAGLDVLDVVKHGNAARALVRLSALDQGENAEQTAVLVARGELEDDYDLRRVEVVGPAVSGELIHAATLGLLVGLLALVAYIWVRFEWHFAIGAVIALAHDVFFTLGFLALAKIEFNIAAVAALLTIAGYSLNDTMVVYDRIRENLRHFRHMPLPILIDDAINRTLSRTVLTSATTLIALAALAAFGGEAIRTFALTLLFGVAIGTVSSIYIAGPILILFRLRPERYRPGKRVTEAAEDNG